MKKQCLDCRDAAIAALAGIAVTVWAFAVAYPFPHPSTWESLVDALAKTGTSVSLRLLGSLGKLMLGFSVSLAYLAVRSLALAMRDYDDEDGEPFFFARCAPLVLVLMVALSPWVWRAFQFLTPESALLAAAVIIVSLCAIAVSTGNLALRLPGGILLGGLCGYSLLVLPTALVLKAIETKINLGRPDRGRRGGIDWLLWTFPCFAAFASAWYFSRTPQAWWDGQSSCIAEAFRNPAVFCATLSPLVLVLVLTIGVALRRKAERGRPLAISLTTLAVFAALVFLYLTFARAERAELRIIRDYTHLVASTTAEARYVFTDGRLDDAIRLTLRERQAKTVLLSMVAEPKARELALCEAAATDPISREQLRHGGLEVLKAWARERPENLEDCAWQFGSGVLSRYGVASAVAGPVLIAERPGREAFAREACERTAAFAERVAAEIDALPDHSAGLDAVLWRLARFSEQTGRRDQALAFYRENRTLSAERLSVFERLIPSASLVLTPREGLDIALKRADFTLAEHYAQMVLASAREDPDALFALAFASLEREDYAACRTYSERYLAVRPNEPSVLNNLSLAYYKLGERDKALESAEKAAALVPDREDVKRNLEFLRQN